MNPSSAVMEAPVDSGASTPTVDSVLDEIVSLTGEQSEEQPTEGEQPAVEAATEQPTEEAPAPEGEQPAAEPADSEYQLSEDGQSYLVPKNDIAGIKALREYTGKVQEWFPTVQDAESARAHASTARQMYNDYASGTEQGIDTLLGFYAGRDVDPRLPDVKAQFQQNFVKMAERIPHTLKSMIGEEAELKFTSSIIQREIDAAYQAAAQSGNPADLKSAQWLDYGWTGQYKTEVPKAAATQNDPLSQREQAITQREQQLLERDWKVFNEQQLEGKKWADFGAEVDRTLTPVKDHYSPDIWSDIRQGVINRVVAKLKEDSVWAAEHGITLNGLQQAFNSRWKSGRDASDLKSSIQAYQNDFMVRARRHLPSIAASILKNAPAKPKGAAAPANGVAKPQAGQPARAANGQFQKPAPSKSAPSRQDQVDKALDEAAKAVGWF